MSKPKKIQTPLEDKDASSLKPGDEVLLSGIIYTARDQAHLRMYDMLKRGEELPIDLECQIIYYCGPTPKGNRIIGSCGPTTSSRMDLFTPLLIEHGLKGMIGKGSRSEDVRGAIKNNKAVYFIAPAGCGAYLSERVKSSQVVAFEDLGPEAIYKLEVEDFPVIVGVDTKGRDLYN